ncbi:hypothetical protein EON65_34970 [archaeon]|nr:MAG: hypothetical protein EON65_34970 [archaeon]
MAISITVMYSIGSNSGLLTPSGRAEAMFGKKRLTGNADDTTNWKNFMGRPKNEVVDLTFIG